MNDYSIIGSFGNYPNRYTSLERIPDYNTDNVSRISDVNDLRNKDETDISFMESLYRNSNPNYYLGGWVVRAVVDILLEFTIGDLPTISGNDKNKDYVSFCNQFWSSNQSQLYTTIKELGLFGQEFVYIGWDSELKSPKMRPLSKRQVIDTRYENFNDPYDITYFRFRDQFQQVKLKDGAIDDNSDAVSYEDVFYDKIFWKELNPKYTEEVIDTDLKTGKRKKQTTSAEEPQWFYKMKILKRVANEDWKIFKAEAINPMGVIPVVEFNQNKLSFDKVGYSDLSGAMKIISIYHQVFESTVNNSLYNSQPTLKFTGLDADPIDFVKRMYGDYSLQSGDMLDVNGLYDVYGSYYLSGDQDVSWLTVPTTASSSKEILNLLFYVLVQLTGVPEWALGAGMEGAWATVKQQSIPLLQKVKAKRMDISDPLLRMNRYAYKVAQYYLNSPKVVLDDVVDYNTKIVWGDVLTNDTDVTLRLVDFMLTRGFITKETAVTIIGLVNDPTSELEKAQEEFKKEQSSNDNTGTFQKLMNKQIDANQNIDEQQQASGGEMEHSESIIRKFNDLLAMIN